MKIVAFFDSCVFYSSSVRDLAMQLAVDGNATHLITFNLKDFDISFASTKGINILHPDEFFSKILKTNLKISANSIYDIIQRTNKPKLTNLIFSAYIKKNNMPKTAEIIASFT